MRQIKIYTVLALSLCCGLSSAQQDPKYSMYRYGMNLINPAYAGSGEKSELGLNFRDQWAGVEGAPETQSLFFGMPMGKNVGLGTSIINDKTFIEEQTALFLDFSYRLKLNDSTRLYLGLKTGFDSYNINTAGLTTYGISADPSLTNLDDSFRFNVGAGAYLKNKNYFISLSVPKLLQSNRLENNDGTARLNKMRIHVYLAGGYAIPMSSSIMFKPTVLARYVPATPFSFDMTALFDFSEQIEVGAAYRVNESFGGVFMLKTIKWFDLGYAYEVPLESSVQSIDNGTHEIMVKIKL